MFGEPLEDFEMEVKLWSFVILKPPMVPASNVAVVA
jgi:hypothetical protein